VRGAARIDGRLLLAHLTHPFGHRHPASLGDAADLGDLVVFAENLQSRSHTMSNAYS